LRPRFRPANGYPRKGSRDRFHHTRARACIGVCLPKLQLSFYSFAMTSARILPAKHTRAAAALVAAGLVAFGSTGVANADDDDPTHQGQYGSASDGNSSPGFWPSQSLGGSNGITVGNFGAAAGPVDSGGDTSGNGGGANMLDPSAAAQFGGATGGASSPVVWFNPTLASGDGGICCSLHAGTGIPPGPFGIGNDSPGGGGSGETPGLSTPIVVPDGQPSPVNTATAQGGQSTPIVPVGAPLAQG
jgi:hypothetical protein